MEVPFSQRKLEFHPLTSRENSRQTCPIALTIFHLWSKMPRLRIETVPHEILCDTFCFLDRNEVEKCHLVSKNWNNFLRYYANFWPLRLLEQLSIYEDNYVTVWLDSFRNSFS